MKLHQNIHIAARFLLLASLLAINAVPFLLDSRSHYEMVFLTLSAIHGEVCLTVAWLLLAATIRPWQGWVWSGIVFASAFIAAQGLLVIRTLSSGNLITAIALLPALAVCLIFFAISRRVSPMRLVTDVGPPPRSRQLRLKDLCTIVAGAAYLSFLVRQLVASDRHGWLWNYGIDVTVFLAVQSTTIGLLLAPWTRILLKPTLRSLWYLAYATVVCAVEPIVHQLLHAKFKVGRWDAFPWPDSYLPIVIDNITWYGPHLLPTAVLIALLRLSGVRVEEKM